MLFALPHSFFADLFFSLFSWFSFCFFMSGNLAFRTRQMENIRDSLAQNLPRIYFFIRIPWIWTLLLFNNQSSHVTVISNVNLWTPELLGSFSNFPSLCHVRFNHPRQVNLYRAYMSDLDEFGPNGSHNKAANHTGVQRMLHNHSKIIKQTGQIYQISGFQMGAHAV